MNLGVVAFNEGDYAAARALYNEALGIKRRLGDRRGMAALIENLGILSATESDLSASQGMLEEALALYRQLGSQPSVAQVLAHLGEVALRRGDLASAHTLHREGLTFDSPLGHRRHVFLSLRGLAQVALGEGRFRRAGTLFGTVEAVRVNNVIHLVPSDRDENASRIAAVQEALGEEAFRAVWEHGKSLAYTQVLEYALSDED